MNNRVIDRKQQRARAIKYEKVGPPDFDRTNNPFCWQHIFLCKWMKFFSRSSQVVYVHDKDQLYWKKPPVGLPEATKDTMIAAWAFSFRLESCACALILTIEVDPPKINAVVTPTPVLRPCHPPKKKFGTCTWLLSHFSHVFIVNNWGKCPRGWGFSSFL